VLCAPSFAKPDGEARLDDSAGPGPLTDSSTGSWSAVVNSREKRAVTWSAEPVDQEAKGH